MLTILFIIFSGCKKFVQVPPPATSITSATVYTSDLSAASAVTSIYINMMSSLYNLSGGEKSISCLTGMAADEFTNYSTNSFLTECYTNSLQSSNNYFWDELYQEIYVTNAVLEGLSNSSGVTSAEKQQLIGEAKFMRAFLHFYGTNLFGAFPVVTTTNYQVNNTISRSPPTEVYQQIIADLTDAQSLLPDNFVNPTGQTTTTERIRPNKWAAAALLARVYLYQTSWDSAEMEATLVINNSSLFDLDTLNGVFLANSNEAIWQMQPVRPGAYNTYDAYTYVLTSPPNSNHPVALTNSLVGAFENGDQRFAEWVGSYIDPSGTYYFPYKYKVNTYQYNGPITEYLMVLRLAEQYLIRAEARAQQGNLQGAILDLDTIRNRAGLSDTTANTQAGLLSLIYHERQVELFSEWGHRWFDLIRTGNVNAVMSVVTPQKGGSWSSNWALFPIPQSELTINPNLKQNSGYNP